MFDPFTGSGSALIAARRTGRRGVGVELSETHAETALQRIRTEATQLDLLSEGEAARQKERERWARRNGGGGDE